jgi:hypothetical protein
MLRNTVQIHNNEYLECKIEMKERDERETSQTYHWWNRSPDSKQEPNDTLVGENISIENNHG